MPAHIVKCAYRQGLAAPESAVPFADNAFATALNQRPLDLGADISFRSATKLIGGHSDLLTGVVTVRRQDLRAALRRSRELSGATPGALESYLAARGARTMALRFERAQANAMILAERLHEHPRVARTRYPGLSSHPTHAVAREQLQGFGTIISFDVRGDPTSQPRCKTSRRPGPSGGVATRRVRFPGIRTFERSDEVAREQIQHLARVSLLALGDEVDAVVAAAPLRRAVLDPGVRCLGRVRIAVQQPNFDSESRSRPLSHGARKIVPTRMMPSMTVPRTTRRVPATSTNSDELLEHSPGTARRDAWTAPEITLWGSTRRAHSLFLQEKKREHRDAGVH